MWQKAKNLYHLILAFFFHFLYGNPSQSLTIVGITGTSGKTTTTHMVYEILKKAGIKVAMISTIQAIIGGKAIDTGFHVTTPDPWTLAYYLKKAKDAGDTHVVLEVSSHSLDQNRVSFIHFDIGVLTTLQHEHLDYHKTFENYAKAKYMLLQRAKKVLFPIGAINRLKDAHISFDEIRKKTITYGISRGDISQASVHLSPRIPGEFNLRDALAAYGVARELGISDSVAKQVLSQFAFLPGRFEEIQTKRGFQVIIDFAHKPDALEELLKTCITQKNGQGDIIVLYGCASERDILKREMMGKISGKLAKYSILTDEDPRNENSLKIIGEIAKGCREAGAKEADPLLFAHGKEKGNVFFKIPNRKEAIDFAINTLAKKGDSILLCGKGHEKSMNYFGKELPWSEHKAVRDALQKK